jgi:hypothetical protein
MTKKERADFITALKSETAFWNPDGRLVEVSAKEMMRLASAHQRLRTRDCNFGLTDREEAKQERVRTNIKEIADALGLSVRFGGDPRGVTCAVVLPADSPNHTTWGRDGLAVPCVRV